ncbi:hypothetical protein [Plantactinospora endophytica]|uniref:Uncharacterized protein n=1 Tax=Plantactinospora endophytica TaxID=673535 RepID=A0ABQ4DSP5_9ACTN|nr:hypothetical protein [Plantactinospora endophytica]GIG85127.1 hypothetical protein Pen02_00630 [Plantactinospora endophytica]
MQGRIWFPGNPWPDGHRVTEFAWTGRLDGTGRLWFDLMLESADYDADDEDLEEAEDEDIDDDEDDDVEDFLARNVWQNYHSCTLGSTWEDATGLVAATPGRPFRLAGPEPQRLTADPLPIADPHAAPAFRIYLLGHDSVAEHQIEITPEPGGGERYRIGWQGRVALTYTGDSEFRYTFRADLRDVELGHVDIPETLSVDEARQRLTELVNVPEWFVPAEVDGRTVLKLVGPTTATPVA